MNNDVIIYTRRDINKLYFEKNLRCLIECIAYKYGIVCGLNNKPKIRATKRFIQNKCQEYFKVDISLKQINYLLRPQKGYFPYTSIIIIETIYNLLKEERWSEEWEERLRRYIVSTMQCDCQYEEFVLGDLSRKIIDKAEDFMKNDYREIFVCFVECRERYLMAINNISIYEHYTQKFPSGYFTRDNIPQVVYTHQTERKYIKVR